MKACRCGSLLTSASGLSSLLVRGRVLRNEIHRELRAKIAFWKTRVVSARESLRLSALIFEPRAGRGRSARTRVATGADGDVERELSSRGPPDRCTVPGSFYVFIVTFSRTVASMYRPSDRWGRRSTPCSGRAFELLNTRAATWSHDVLLHLSFGVATRCRHAPARHDLGNGPVSALLLAPRSLIHSLISAVSLHFLARRALAVEPMSPLPCHHASCSVYGFILLYSLRGP